MLITKLNIDKLASAIVLSQKNGRLGKSAVTRYFDDAYILNTVKNGARSYEIHIGKHKVAHVNLDDFKVTMPATFGQSPVPQYHPALVSKMIEDACLNLLEYEIEMGVNEVINALGHNVEYNTVINGIQINIYDVTINDNRKDRFIDLFYNGLLWHSAPISSDVSELKESLSSIIKRKILDGSTVVYLN